MLRVIPEGDPSGKPSGATVERLRSDLPAGALVGGAVAENHDLDAALSAKPPLVIGVVAVASWVSWAAPRWTLE